MEAAWECCVEEERLSLEAVVDLSTEPSSTMTHCCLHCSGTVWPRSCGTVLIIQTEAVDDELEADEAVEESGEVENDVLEAGGAEGESGMVEEVSDDEELVW